MEYIQVQYHEIRKRAINQGTMRTGIATFIRTELEKLRTDDTRIHLIIDDRELIKQEGRVFHASPTVTAVCSIVDYIREDGTVIPTKNVAQGDLEPAQSREIMFQRKLDAITTRAEAEALYIQYVNNVAAVHASVYAGQENKKEVCDRMARALTKMLDIVFNQNRAGDKS